MKRFALVAIAALTLGACVPSEEVVLTSGGIGVGSTGTVITTGTTHGQVLTGASTTVVSSSLSSCDDIAYSKTGEYCAD
ncbi:MAG: hypothetical protein CMM70_07755 [Rhodospirillaceae bacterium]|nr:hypothetical protein [Rhodospirillaceae bacterium]